MLDPRQTDPPGIARSETLLVDGLPERLLIRGRGPAHNPVLLFVHGGPGFPGAVFRQINSELERDFTVVHWDQRGAGYSYRRGIPPATMRVEQFVRETLLVSHALAREFSQPKIYLVGHSWGTLPAALAAAREPELFHAYVALSQLVNIDESARQLTGQALDFAREKGAWRSAAKLRRLGPPPYRTLPAQDRAAGLITDLFPHVSRRATSFRLGLIALTSRYYSVPALFHVSASYRFSRGLLDPQLHGYDLRRLAPEIDAPVYFFVGRRDATFGLSVQREYFRALVAPRGKHFVLFEDSTHWPHLEQPEGFLAQMERVRAETFVPSPRPPGRR